MVEPLVGDVTLVTRIALKEDIPVCE